MIGLRAAARRFRVTAVTSRHTIGAVTAQFLYNTLLSSLGDAISRSALRRRIELKLLRSRCAARHHYLKL